MVESWLNPDGEMRGRKNRIVVEVVGRDAEKIAREAHLGAWVTIEGYIRSEQFKGQDLIKVRTLSIDIWESQHAERSSISGHGDSDGGTEAETETGTGNRSSERRETPRLGVVPRR
jgi:single-stranded DNA-binding protein